MCSLVPLSVISYRAKLPEGSQGLTGQHGGPFVAKWIFVSSASELAEPVLQQLSLPCLCLYLQCVYVQQPLGLYADTKPGKHGWHAI